ncbi:MAG: hypothetical protein HYV07_05565, partial [Deltaproteobacteria bacterium]|nr:hypothetical protein [Deltaproteobacteria bacterium]
MRPRFPRQRPPRTLERRARQREPESEPLELSQRRRSWPRGLRGLLPGALPGGPQTTCNGEFSVELVSATSSASHATYVERVCKLGTGPATKDLSHFDVQLSHLAACTGANVAGAFVACSILDPRGNERCGLQLSPADPTTGVAGLKFDELSLGDGECQSFSFTLDTSRLAPGFLLDEGTAVVATKAG